MFDFLIHNIYIYIDAVAFTKYKHNNKKKKKMKAVCNKTKKKYLKTSYSFRWDKVNDSREKNTKKHVYNTFSET